MHRAHVQHGAAAVGVHVLERGPGNQEGAVQVDTDDFAPVGQLKLVDRVDVLNAGIGQGDVESTPSVHHSLDAGLDRLFVGDIHRHRHGGSARRLDRRHRLIGALQREVGHRHFRTFTAVGLRNGPAYASAGAGYQRNLIFQTHLFGSPQS